MTLHRRQAPAKKKEGEGKVKVEEDTHSRDQNEDTRVGNCENEKEEALLHNTSHLKAQEKQKQKKWIAFFAALLYACVIFVRSNYLNRMSLYLFNTTLVRPPLPSSYAPYEKGTIKGRMVDVSDVKFRYGFSLDNLKGVQSRSRRGEEQEKLISRVVLFMDRDTKQTVKNLLNNKLPVYYPIAYNFLYLTSFFSSTYGFASRYEIDAYLGGGV